MPDEPKPYDVPQEDWEWWQRERERLVSAGLSLAYAPPERLPRHPVFGVLLFPLVVAGRLLGIRS